MNRRNIGEDPAAWPALVDFFSLGMVIMLVLFVTVGAAWERERRSGGRDELRREVERLRRERDLLEEQLGSALRRERRWAKAVRGELERMKKELVRLSPVFGEGDLAVPPTDPPHLEVRSFRGRQVTFATREFQLRPTDEALLRRAAGDLARVIRQERWKAARYAVEIRGEADPRPFRAAVPPRNNRELSALRAAGVAAVLLDGGVDKRELRVVGLGSVAPAATATLRPGETEEERDRRLAEYRTVRLNIVAEARRAGRGNGRGRK